MEVILLIDSGTTLYPLLEDLGKRRSNVIIMVNHGWRA